MTTRRSLESIAFRPRPRTMGQAILVELEGVIVVERWMRAALAPATRAALAAFCERHAMRVDVAELLHDVRLSIPRPSVTDAALVAALDRWSAEDRAHPALRALHGLVWDELFANGGLSAQVHPDAGAALKRWSREGRALIVYSSRPESAQSLLLARSALGAIDREITAFVQVDTVERRDPRFVRSVARRMDIDVESLVVLAESTRDLTAAAVAGASVMQVLRGDDHSDGEYFWTRSLDTIEFDHPHRVAV